jgi:CysZ protein
MNVFKGFGEGLGSYSRALNFIFKHKLSYFFIFPLLLNILLFAVGYSWIIDLSDYIKDGMYAWISDIDYGFINNDYIKGSLSFLLKLVFRISFFLIFLFFGGYLILAIMSPVFSILSERTERILTGKDYPFDVLQLFKDIVRGVLLAVRNAFFQLLIAILLFFLSFIPLLGFVTPVIMFLVSSYFYGFSFIDYAIERKRIGFKESVLYMKNNKGLVMGNGFVFALLLLIPFIGILLSSFAAIVSVVAGTMLVAEKEYLLT